MKNPQGCAQSKWSVHHWVAIAALLSSIIGILIYGTFLTIPGPIRVAPTALGMWLTCLNFYFSFLLFYQACHKHEWVKVGILYHFLATIIYLVIGLCYGFGFRLDVAAWTFVGVLVNLLSLHAIIGHTWQDDDQKSEFTDRLVQNSDLWTHQDWPEDIKNRDKSSCMANFLTYLNVTIAVLAMLLLAMLIGGAVIQVRAFSFDIDGVYADVPINNSHVGFGSRTDLTLRIRYLCKGPNDTKSPTFIIDSDGAHAAADFYGLQDILAKNGRRSCIFDKPGVGWSDNYFALQNMDPMTWYDSLMNSMNERPPFTFVGWGGGSATIWQYATLHPEMVSGIVFLDAYGDGIEWRVQQYLNNWTESQLLEFRKQDLSGRYNLFALIRALAVPWGIIELLEPTDPATYYPPEKYDEYHWYYVTAKTWPTQYFTLLNMAKAKLEKGWLGVFNTTNPRLERVPLLHVISDLSDTDVCLKNNVTWGTKQCDELVKENKFMVAEQLILSQLTRNGTVVRCVDISCDLSFPVSKANWTAQVLLSATTT